MSPTLLTKVLKDVRKSNEFDWDRVQHALETAASAYEDMEHWSGESMMDHVAGVLKSLLRFEPDEDAVIACILHHVLQSEHWTLSELEEQFGPTVRSLVGGVHLLSHVTVHGRRYSIDDLRIMLLTVSEDIRTILITLCDRAHIISRLSDLKSEDSRRVAQDALYLFAPVAARLGIYGLKHELENNTFHILYPNDAEHIREQVEQLHDQKEDFLQNTCALLTKHLGDNGIQARVLSREKQMYSIFTKMRSKSLSHIQDLHDFYAIRILVDSVEDCYHALGIVHSIARPATHRFKDYISFPKPNGYQSLHTTVMQMPGAPEEAMVEIQVRTEEMHREAEFGIAAHWSYKEYGSTQLAMEQAQLHKMLASQEVLEEDNTVQLADHIFALTPKGDIIELPEGASPLDFAFQVHSEVGLSYRGARVNGAMVSIDYELENGDVVEVLRHNTPRPSPQWYQLLKVSSAKSKLKRYLYAQERPEMLDRGKQLVNEMLRKNNLPLLDSYLTFLSVCDGKELSIQQRQDILVKIGQGSEKASSLLERTASTIDNSQLSVDDIDQDISVDRETVERKVRMHGDMQMPHRYALCCKPHQQKATKIVGLVNRKGEVMIHRKSCSMLKNANKDRFISVEWT